MRTPSVFLIALLVSSLLSAQDNALRISVIAGEDSRQYAGQKVHVEPTVEVDDATGKPVPDAPVIFTLPASGPGGLFESGGPSLRVTTDAQGRAVAHGIKLNKLMGPFAITVNASSDGRSGTATIHETSVRPPRSNGAFGISTRTWVFLGLGLLVIAGGIVAAKELKGGRNTNVLTATPGTPVVGGPQ